MVTPLCSPNNGHRNGSQSRAQVLRLITMAKASSSRAVGMPDRAWLLEFANALQTTLDLEELLALFIGRVSTLLTHDGLAYTNEPEGIGLRFGEDGQHSCTYDIAFVDDHLGTMTFTRSSPFVDRELLLVENLLCNLVYPLRNALMYRRALQSALTDSLTGVNNRGGMQSMLRREVELAHRHGTPLSVIMLDVDRFKRINDTHGHLVGDCALRTLAQHVKSRIRESDMIFRYGGDEFLIVLSNTPASGASLLAERIRKAVEAVRVHSHDISIHCTVSAGVASCVDGDDVERLLERADQALGQSKSAGRNRVTHVAGDTCLRNSDDQTLHNTIL